MRTAMFALVLSVSCGTAWSADLFAGTWKLDTAKSTNNWGQKPAKSMTRTYTPTANGGYEVKIEGVDSEGQAISNTLQAATNTERPIGQTSSPVIKMIGATHVLSKRVDDHTLVATYLKDGKKLGTSTSKVSADGHTLTMTLDATASDGKKLKGTTIYHK